MNIKLYNRLTSIVKIGGIWLADGLNKLRDPFDEITRAPDVKYNELLFVKAQKFETDFVQNFLTYNVIWAYSLPFNTGDQCLWQGIATAMWAFKYSVTQSDDDMFYLKNSLVGMGLHQTIHCESKPRLIRGFRVWNSNDPTGSWVNGDQKFFTAKNGNQTYVVEDAASNDSMSGHLAGLYFAWVYGPQSVKDTAVSLIRSFADEVLNNNYSIINADGTPTQYGQLLQGALTDPLRLSLGLALFKVAYTVTGDPKYQDAYKFIVGNYNDLANYPKVKLWTFDNDNDSHRAAIHLSILSDLEKDPELSEDYKKGLARVWAMTHKTGNVWIAYLNARHNQLTPQERDICQMLLSEFTVEDDTWAVEKINSTRETELLNQGVKLFTWGGHLRSSQPLAKWRMGKQDFFWQRNLNSVDNWQGMKVGDLRYNGLDFMIAYWLGRNLRLLDGTK